MLKTILFIGMIILFLGSVILLMVQKGLILLKKGNSESLKSKSKKTTKVVVISLVAAFLLVVVSQIQVYTPKIHGENSISELIKVDINGSEQWLSIRGRNRNNPVLLFLAGGPGGSQIGAVRRNLKSLEESFVVVNWEQPGSGKSFSSIETEKLTPSQYIQDGLKVTEYLKKRFNHDKIYLMGESWGSALGVFLIKENPKDYYAFIGTGQMVAFEETERACYQKALEIARKNGDDGQVKKLKAIGEPPYYGEGMALKTSTYLQYLSKEMTNHPMIHNAGYETFNDLASKEYGILDQINFFRGLIKSFSQVYPKLYPIDLREEYTELKVPIYIFHGKYDLNAPSTFVKEYYNLIEAPEKKLIWFEHSGHSPWINENELFCKKVTEVFTKHVANDERGEK